MIKIKSLENQVFPEMSGTYTLVIYVDAENVILKVGKLGTFKLKGGYYLYTGSALGKGALSLNGRVKRHLKRKKKLRWHIDYLLFLREASVHAVVMAKTEKRMECEINKELKKISGVEIPIYGFGSSDCRMGCNSHLLYLGQKDPIMDVAKIYEKKTGESIVLK